MFKFYIRKPKILMKEIKEINKWKGISCSWKTQVLPSLIYRKISIKFPGGYYVDYNKLILKLLGKGKRPRIANTTLKKNKVGGLTLTDSKAYYKAIVFNSVWYQQRNRN